MIVLGLSVAGKLSPNARDWTQRKGSRHRKLTDEERARNRHKSRVRAKVEHPFGFTKVRYRGLQKNAHRLWTACALSNPVMAKKALLRKPPHRLQPSCA